MPRHKTRHYHKIEFIFKNQKYTLLFEPISIIKAAEIDYQSYSDGQYSTIKQWQSVFKNVNFKLFLAKECIFDSLSQKNLEFNLGHKIFDFIQSELYLSPEEAKIYTKECIYFVSNKTTKMPPEILIAGNIINGKMQLNLSELESISVKKYEKIQICLSTLRQVSNQEKEKQ